MQAIVQNVDGRRAHVQHSIELLTSTTRIAATYANYMKRISHIDWFDLLLFFFFCDLQMDLFALPLANANKYMTIN